MDAEQLSSGLTHALDWCGNFLADKLAKAGAIYSNGDLNIERATEKVKGARRPSLGCANLAHGGRRRGTAVARLVAS